MKKIVYVLGIAAMVAGCQEVKVETEPISTGEGFAIEALLPGTKTTFTPPYAVEWAAGDALAVFSQQGETTATKFTLSDGNTFKSEDFISNPSYLHVFYPYTEGLTLGDATNWDWSTSTVIVGCAPDGTQKQNGIGVDGMAQAHIKAPLAGWASGTSVTMQHVTTLLDVQLMNNTEGSIEVSKVTVNTSENHDLVGNYYISAWNKEISNSNGYDGSQTSETSSTAILEVTGGTISSGETGHFYLITAPFTIAATETLTVTINTDKGDYTKEVSRTSAIALEKGKVNHIEVSAVEPSEVIPISADAGEEYQPGYDIEKAYDNNYETNYHSRWSGATVFPVVLTFKFDGTKNIDYLVFAANSGQGRPGRCNIYYKNSSSTEWIITESAGAYANATAATDGNWDFDMTQSAAKKAVFNTPMEKPTEVKFEFYTGYCWDSSNGYISIIELDFYTYDTTTTVEQ